MRLVRNGEEGTIFFVAIFSRVILPLEKPSLHEYIMVGPTPILSPAPRLPIVLRRVEEGTRKKIISERGNGKKSYSFLTLIRRRSPFD